jgi:hypothetical protein
MTVGSAGRVARFEVGPRAVDGMERSGEVVGLGVDELACRAVVLDVDEPFSSRSGIGCKTELRQGLASPHAWTSAQRTARNLRGLRSEVTTYTVGRVRLTRLLAITFRRVGSGHG